MQERVIGFYEDEYCKLEAVAKLLQMESPNKARYVVENVYLDFGQDWMWTTICRKGYSECQVLNPREWKLIMDAQTAEDIAKIVRIIREDRFFGDKEREA